MSTASLWMLAASALFACMGVCVKLGAGHFSAAELVFYRGAIALAGLWIYVRLRRLPLATPHGRAHLWRGLSGSLSLMLYFYAIGTLPLATAVTLNYTSPLFLALILALWGGERVGRWLWLALCLGLAGVALLLRPSLAAEQWPAGLAALGSGLSAGMAYYNVRQLGRLGEPEWRTVFYFSLTSTLLGLPWLAAGEPVHTLGGRGLLLMLGVGIFGALAQLAMTRAYRQGRTLATASLAYSTVVFASLFGMLLWDEVLPGRAWLGIGFIAAGGVIATACSRAPLEQD